MKNIIVGTAGHIDHGKTSLVRALTGIDADRLPEEKRRGITIDLGFAHADLAPDLRLGFVDVPGHERFVRNMLAGAGGIDLVLLVIAADESIKPQTREHFEICRLLGIAQGIVVLTKTDLVSPDLVELVELEASELVRGSFLETAPVVPVSAETGAGLDALRAALLETGRKAPGREQTAPARLPVDRAFAVRGFGTVVTGTLLSGTLRRGDELVLLPQSRTVRARGIEVHGETAAYAEAGSRTAVNIPDVERHDVSRGMVLAEPGRFEATHIADCAVTLLAGAPRLKTRAPVHFYAGTAETEARVRLFGTDSLAAGSQGFARLRFAEPVVLAHGDRFILRQFSPVITIGGGTILDTRPPRERRISRIQGRLTALAGDAAAIKAALLIGESGLGLAADDLARRLAIAPARAIQLARVAGAAVLDEGDSIVSRESLQAVGTKIRAAVVEFHRNTPLAAGIAKSELRSRFLPNAPVCVFDAALAVVPELIAQGDIIHHKTHRVELSGDERKARDLIAGILERAGLAVPSMGEVLASAGLDPARSQTLLRMLIKENVLVRVSPDLIFHRGAIDSLRRALAARKHQSFTVSAFKDWTGVSRKFAVPLLEYLDREHVTARRGDERIVL